MMPLLGSRSPSDRDSVKLCCRIAGRFSQSSAEIQGFRV